MLLSVSPRLRGASLTLALVLLVGHGADAGEIAGSIRDASTGDPLAGAHVILEGTHHGGSTDLDGRFRLLELPAGRYVISISHLGYTTHSDTVTLASSTDRADLEVTLRPDLVELDRVVYTATRTMQLLKDVPLSTEVISKAEMRESGALTAAEALESEIGVEVRNDFSGQGVMLQGVDPERVLILVDGNRVIGRINGSIDLDQLSTQGVKQVEVVKGALSTLYGSEAIGGVVNIITEEPLQPLVITAEMTGGAYLPSAGGYSSAVPAGVFSPAVDVQARRGDIGVQAGVRYDDLGLMDSDPATPHTDGAEAARRLSGHGKLTWDLSERTTATLTGRYFDEDKNWVEDSGLTSIQLAYDDKEVNRRLDLGAEVRITPAWAELYSIKLFHSNNDHVWGKYSQGEVRRRIDVSEAREAYTELSGQATRSLGDAHRLTVGADIYRWTISSHTEFGGIADDFEGDLTAWDAYIQDEWYLHDKLTLVPGLRYERHEVYGDNLSPKLSAMWKLPAELKLRGSVGRGYRAPSSKELYFTFNHASAGYIVHGNEQLEPETSLSYMLSLEHTYKDRSTSRISVFHNDLRNLIDFDSLATNEQFYVGVYQYNNIVSAYTRGVELERSMRLGGGWRLAAAYSYLQTHNRETGGELLRRPSHSARLNAGYRQGPFNARLLARYTSSMLYQSIYATDDQVSDERTNPYTLFDLNVGYRFSPEMEAMLSVDNALDTVDPRYGPYRGRVVRITWRYTWS